MNLLNLTTRFWTTLPGIFHLAFCPPLLVDLISILREQSFVAKSMYKHVCHNISKIWEYKHLKVGDWLNYEIHIMEYSNHLKGCVEIDLVM